MGCDEGGAECDRHGVRFTEAASVFLEEDHSLVLGYSIRERMLLVVHVIRGERIRVISARKATPNERRRYDEARGR
jgi:uncharacterized DUF497 family protein